MKLNKVCAALAACGLALGFSAANAQKLSDDKIVIGFVTDMSSLYSDIDGPGGVEAIRMAIADMQKEFPGKKIELVFADHQNKADIASAKVREWIDQGGADVIIGGTNSSTALASAKIAAEKKRPYIQVGAASSRLTNEDCTPYTVHYAYDTIALANGTGGRLVELPDLASIPPTLKGESKLAQVHREATLWDNWLTLVVVMFLYSLDVALRRLAGLS